MRCIKLLQLLFALLFPYIMAAQASDSREFAFTIVFEKAIQVENVEVYYFDTRGSYFPSVSYTVNKAGNSMELKGVNDFIVGMSFPVLFFSVREKEITQEGGIAQEVNSYYLISKYRFEPRGLPVINFTKDAPNVYIDTINGTVKALTDPGIFRPELSSRVSNKVYRVNRQMQE